VWHTDNKALVRKNHNVFALAWFLAASTDYLVAGRPRLMRSPRYEGNEILSRAAAFRMVLRLLA
jgi:hypothetical protein